MRALHTAMVVVGVSVLALCAPIACGAEDHERIAEAVALEWTANEAERISEEIAAEMTRRRGRAVPVTVKVFFDRPSSSGGAVQLYEETLRSTADADEIRDTLAWAFGAPTRKPDGQYAIIATASLSFEIAPSRANETLRELPGGWFPATSHRGSIDYELEIDTVTRAVTSATLLLKSARITDLPRESTGVSTSASPMERRFPGWGAPLLDSGLRRNDDYAKGVLCGKAIVQGSSGAGHRHPVASRVTPAVAANRG